MRLAIYDQEQKYHTDLESFCDRNCVLQLLNYYGIQNSSFYINASLNFHFFKDEEKPLGYYANFNTNCLVDECMHKMHVHTEPDKNPLQIWQENKLKIDAGIPIITGVDIYYLNHSANYKTYHSNHKCILCGYSEEKQLATLIDWYDWKYKGNISLDSFLNARSSLCPTDESPYSGFPIKNEWSELDQSNWSINIEESIKNTITKSINQYYENPLTDNSNNYYGIDGIKKLYSFFEEYKNTSPETMTILFKNIRIIFLMLYSHLKLFRYYISEASNYVNNGVFDNLVQSLNADIEQWRKAVVIMLKGTVNVSESSYFKIANKINELIILEEQRYKVIKDLNSRI